MSGSQRSGGIRDASSVVPWRSSQGVVELFWVRRSREVSLGGGFYAFPGGRVDGADAALEHALGSDAFRIAAARELFEEVGLLVGTTRQPPTTRDEQRRQLLAGAVAWAEVLARLDAQVALDRLVDAGRWLTPPFMKVRFDARFFLLECTPDDTPEVWPGELADGEWITPEAALDRWQRGSALLHPPALHILKTLASAAPRAWPERLREPPHVVDFVAERIEFQAGIRLVPVRTPTLPPATHTNAYILGGDELIIVDPASGEPEEQARLERICRTLQAEGKVIREIVLTHEHHDHVGGVEALRAALGLRVRAHELTAERLAGRVHVDGFIEDGETWALRGAPAMRWRAVHTPGHARGHLCLLEEASRALIAGDMVAGIGTIVVDPPEGDMSDYVASLAKLRSLAVNTIYPAHGPAIPDGLARLDEYLAHRAQREWQVFEALRARGSATALELVPAVYADVAPALHPLAARSLSAVLHKLVKDGRVAHDEDAYRLR